MSEIPPPSSPPPPPPPPLRALPVDVPAQPPPMPGAPPFRYPTPPVVVPRRPGIITAVGVVSIVVASMGILASLYGVLSLVGFSFQVRFAGMRATAATVTSATMPATPPAVAPAVVKETIPVSPRGLNVAERRGAMQGLAELRFLTAPRAEQLDVLLAKAGRDMFPVRSGAPLTAETAQDMVVGHATGLSANPDVEGPDTFRTKGGRFEVYDDRAVFYPNAGEIVRATTLTSATAGLNAEQVEKVVQQAQAASGSSMNPAQLAALRTLLTTPGQQHVSPITLPTAVRDVQAGSGGTFVITFPNGWASIGPQGQTVSSLAAGPGGAPFPGAPKARIHGAAMAVAVFATVAGLGLALYLLVCGILVLRESPRGRKLHLIYAGLKIPVSIAGALAVWWLASDFIDAARQDPGVGHVASTAEGLAISHAVMGAVGLIYPIALLIGLQTKAVKDYYRGGD